MTSDVERRPVSRRSRDRLVKHPTVVGAAARTSSRTLRLWVAAVVSSAFGPYVVGGVRTEQLVVYGSVAAVLIFGWPLWRGLRNAPTPAPFMILWGAITAIASVGAIWPPFNQTAYASGNPLAGMDNWALPMATVVLTAFWCERLGSRAVAIVTSYVVLVAMLVNAVISVLARMIGNYGLTPWVEYFWMRADGGGVAVATNALGNGRFTGVFNQPAEAGIAYSLALLCLAYLARLSPRPRATVITVAAVALTAGGVLSVSKVLLLGGLPLFALLLLRDRVRRTRIALIVVALVLGLSVLDRASLVRDLITQTAQFRMLVESFSIDANTLTAGRLGDGGTLNAVADQMFERHPWLGLGAGGVAAPYDSSWIEALATTGIVGCVLLGSLLVALGLRWFTLRTFQHPLESRLGGCVLILVAGASLGMPAMTGNKVATLLWILLTCLLLNPRQQGLRPPSAGGRPEPHTHHRREPVPAFGLPRHSIALRQPTMKVGDAPRH